uniref:Uncharacterized protein n=1 Tax=Sphaerodactylus townsendi TaxID=933632 RepID=A0ACB8ER89_9SAUR
MIPISLPSVDSTISLKGGPHPKNGTPADWLLSDHGFVLLFFLLIHYSQEVPEDIASYNDAHWASSIVIECSLGELKMQFQCPPHIGGHKVMQLK